jgi:pimeloyl-ACP methyl ester carboxylesterase
MPFVERGDVSLYFEEHGTGPAIVWIPGTGLRGVTWHAQVEQLQSRFRCVTVDLRGSGESTGADTPFTVRDLADDVAAVCDHLRIDRVVAIGLSLGSAVAQELALARPDLVSGLVLLATWSSSSTEHHVRRHFESRLYAIENGPLDVYAKFAFWMFSPYLFDHEPEARSRVEGQLREHMSATPAGTAQHFRADLGHETRDRLGGIGCPCLVVHGEDDLITLPWYNQAVADRIPGAELATIERAGHLAWLERPAELTDLIEKFLPRCMAGHR